jgi:hypothetical protein
VDAQSTSMPSSAGSELSPDLAALRAQLARVKQSSQEQRAMAAELDEESDRAMLTAVSATFSSLSAPMQPQPLPTQPGAISPGNGFPSRGALGRASESSSTPPQTLQPLETMLLLERLQASTSTSTRPTPDAAPPAQPLAISTVACLEAWLEHTTCHSAPLATAVRLASHASKAAEHMNTLKAHASTAASQAAVMQAQAATLQARAADCMATGATSQHADYLQEAYELSKVADMLQQDSQGQQARASALGNVLRDLHHAETSLMGASESPPEMTALLDVAKGVPREEGSILAAALAAIASAHSAQAAALEHRQAGARARKEALTLQEEAVSLFATGNPAAAQAKLQQAQTTASQCHPVDGEDSGHLLDWDVHAAMNTAQSALQDAHMRRACDMDRGCTHANDCAKVCWQAVAVAKQLIADLRALSEEKHRAAQAAAAQAILASQRAAACVAAGRLAAAEEATVAARRWQLAADSLAAEAMAAVQQADHKEVEQQDAAGESERLDKLHALLGLARRDMEVSFAGSLLQLVDAERTASTVAASVVGAVEASAVEQVAREHELLAKVRAGVSKGQGGARMQMAAAEGLLESDQQSLTELRKEQTRLSKVCCFQFHPDAIPSSGCEYAFGMYIRTTATLFLSFFTQRGRLSTSKRPGLPTP